MIYSLESVSKLFAQRREASPALSKITLAVKPGEQVALLGQSGAGKTTLFRLLNGTLRPSGGSLFFDGQDTAALSGSGLRAMRRRVGTIYQQHNLVPSLTAFQNTLCGALGRMSLLSTIRSTIQPRKLIPSAPCKLWNWWVWLTSTPREPMNFQAASNSVWRRRACSCNLPM